MRGNLPLQSILLKYLRSKLSFSIPSWLSSPRAVLLLNEAIRSHVHSAWGLTAPATIGLLDPRHVMIHLANQADFVTAWLRGSKKIENSLFRLSIF